MLNSLDWTYKGLNGIINIVYESEIFMKEFIIDFFTAVPVIELIIILISKAIEVSMGTMRHILVNKGYRKPGAIIAFFEILLWVFIASGVINDIGNAPIKGVVYSLGYAIGVFLGSKLENRLAFGKILIQTITNNEYGMIIADKLREFGLGVTSINGRGIDQERTILMTYTNRKGREKIINFINNIDPDAMVTTNDVTALKGGYVSPWRKIAK